MSSRLIVKLPHNRLYLAYLLRGYKYGKLLILILFLANLQELIELNWVFFLYKITLDYINMMRIIYTGLYNMWLAYE